MHYLISRKSVASQFIQIEISLACLDHETLDLQLPAWRPGRYEMANYAQKIRGFQVKFRGKDIAWNKPTKDLWQFRADEKGTYQIIYEFYANQMDAGGSWSDDVQLYLNFTNCAFEVLQRKMENITIELKIPESFQVATSMPNREGFKFEATDFQNLIDSPLLASENLKHFQYKIAHTTFHLWFQGEIHFDMDGLIAIFLAFTQKQILAFGEFPSEDYHFIFQLLPYPHYHGVEHAMSTVITFGPAESLKEKNNLDKLIGVSSHELYHYWNVCRIRPKELLPFDLSKETYLDTGLVLEGVTTYMGDLMLLKSGYYSLTEYLAILEKQIQREFDGLGWKNQSIVESSLDLWVDGYKPGIPNKKVNIYNRGALITLCLDLMLVSEGSSIEEIMKEMWLNYGKTQLGYTLNDYEELITKKFSAGNNSIQNFFQSFVYGKEDFFNTLEKLLAGIGVKVIQEYNSDFLVHRYGIKFDPSGKIIEVHPESKAYYQVMLGDKILELNGIEFSAEITHEPSEVTLILLRWGRIINVDLKKDPTLYFPNYSLMAPDKVGYQEMWKP
ncbi:M61 family metallopeptidase [Rhodonellum sp.]|uniref:M61 family metallopeptidase n=1 Tax=Rhodonellum sp. TaxID=2231180 RepID=UPI002727DA41|nr:M61 family peptidase [Rhodonellum sp.]MDO9551937.1 M61 family peptidase [Rhodonellum sp.]